MADDNYSASEPFITINNNFNHNSSTTASSIRRSSNSFNKLINNQSELTPSPTNTISKKTFKFDEIYGSQADQLLLYSNVALPLLKDFINGQNITILAYGQTGTGKTYTMCGLNDQNIDSVPLPEVAGIIPRLLSQLFEILDNESLDNDYIVKISFLEIYNEELIDLLSQQNKKLRIHEKVNPTTKSTATSKSIAIQNLSEFTISNYEESIKLLRMGLNKKRTASTNLNEHSSRSHTIFGIQLFKKDVRNDTMYIVSKMNLVDLAGSENIGRSGSVVKEAGGINQSLLTLGRVINSLNDKKTSQHIPYRESKLTHILQDSLGGNTKTALIATISPAQINGSETTSTLDYASKAKNIKNLPQNGNDSEMILKKTLVKQLSKEINQLNMDLIATRNKNGIYLDADNYNQLLKENESLKTDMKESSLRIESLSRRSENNKASLESNKLEISKLHSENDELRQKLEALESKHKLSVQASARKDLTIDSLNGKLNQISEKSSNSAVLLMNLFSNHLSSSINMINDSLSIQSGTGTSKRLNELQNQLQSNLHNYKENLEQKIEYYQNNIQTLATKDLSDIFNSFKTMFDDLFSCQKTMYNNVQEIFTELKIANEKLSGFLKDDYLTSIDEKICKKQYEYFKDNLKLLYDNLKSEMNKEIEKCLSSASQNNKNIVHDEISKERRNMLTYEENWKHQINDILPSLEKEIKISQQVNESKSLELEKIREEGITKLDAIKREKLQLPSDDLPNVSKLSQVSKDLLLDHRLITCNLKEVNENLSKIQKFDAKKEFSISPTRSMISQTDLTTIKPSKRSLSLSPQKIQETPNTNLESNNNNTNIRLLKSPSKIPTFKRSETTISSQQNKKRKVFSPIESNLM
ncbi:CIN8 [Candida jiufengensis]|uniref:CIN8 n=1 Tax=Candida jiufengensis TaxID=497108 RepID=UPI00222469F7|nr:CIN8 [Candida jiufengensis]KAI5954593.1 CIN8 [Candida jiufengensis]